MVRILKKGKLFGILLVFIALIFATLPTNVCAEPVEDWIARYNGPDNFVEYPNGMGMDSNGNVYVAIGSYSFASLTDWVIISYDPSGNLRWMDIYNGEANSYDNPQCLVVSSTDTIYITGNSYGFGTDSDYLTMAYDTDGNRLWMDRYDGPASDAEWAKDIAINPVTGVVYVSGWATVDGIFDITWKSDITTIAYDTNGNRLWIASYNGPGDRYDDGKAVACDPNNGNVYVTGWSEGISGDVDYVLIAYDSLGNQLWVERYDGPMHKDDYSEDIVIDSSGNVYIHGVINDPFVSGDFCTIAYDSLGNRLWIATYDGPANGDDFGIWMALDSSENIYVSGLSQGVGTSHDYAVVSYDKHGNYRWEARYDGPGHGFEMPFEFVLTNTEELYIIGYSTGDGTGEDVSIVAYDTSSGEELWVIRYDGPASGADRGYWLELDLAGNIYAGAATTGVGTNLDGTVIKYSVSPTEGLTNLIANIESMELPQGIENSLISKLENAMKSIINDRPSATGQLGAFINEVNAQRGVSLTDEQANSLIVAAQWIIDKFSE